MNKSRMRSVTHEVRRVLLDDAQGKCTLRPIRPACPDRAREEVKRREIHLIALRLGWSHGKVIEYRLRCRAMRGRSLSLELRRARILLRDRIRG